MLATPSPAHRAHDALLAQPLRHQPAEGAHRPAHVPPERAAAARGAGQLRHAAARHRARPGDADLPRQRRQPPPGAQRELRARGDGALHAGRGPLRRARHQGGGARLHRLEPRPRHAASSSTAACGTTAARRRCSASTGRFDGDAGARHPARAPRDRASSSPRSCGSEFVSPTPDAREVEAPGARCSARRATR